MVGGSYNRILSLGWANVIAGGSDNYIGDSPNCAEGGPTYSACSVFGGHANNVRNDDADVFAATAGGGRVRPVSGDYDWMAGSLFEDE
jgi:hypothetical protein